mgnify:CR=1 FL=1
MPKGETRSPFAADPRVYEHFRLNQSHDHLRADRLSDLQLPLAGSDSFDQFSCALVARLRA